MTAQEASHTPRCCHCGETRDLYAAPVYVGGRGYVERVECRVLADCWTRQEHALEGTAGEQPVRRAA